MAKKKKKAKILVKRKKAKVVISNINFKYLKSTSANNAASWNGIKFRVSSKELTNLSSLDISESYTDEYDDSGKKTGRELTTFSVNITYFTPKAGDLKNARSAMNKWRSMLGKDAYFYLGGSKLFTRKCKLLGVNSGNIIITDSGGMIAVDLQLDFRWARTKAQEKAAAKAAKNSPTKKSSTKTSSKNKTSSAGNYDGGKMTWPLPGHKKISSNYGKRTCPFHGPETHTGIDIPAPHGTAIKAAAAGTIVLAGVNSTYGNCVIISHGKNIWTLYGHCSSLIAKKGQAVKAGESIAKVGSTGNSTGNHLHFEVRKGANSSKNAVNPKGYVS